MARRHNIRKVNIRPGVSVLSVLSHLNYRPWFALAEFVDNSIQSYLSSQSNLSQEKLRVAVDIDTTGTGHITVRDNAAGITASEFPRAFRPAELPPDTSGLCEFGMGMKSAACWFAPRWSVRTSALGEKVERKICFDIERIVRDSIDELEVETQPCESDIHFTEIVLCDLHHVPVGRTHGKIRTHLEDIYRIFVRDEILDLHFNGEELRYKQPDILNAPHYRSPSDSPLEWRKEFDFDFGPDLRAHGFAAIRKRASTSRAGFALFRRKRLIQGSGDEGYRPEFIFGKPNTFPFQRVFGEIHLEGFDVSHTKDGFQWDENEQPFLELLREELSDKRLPLLQQAREYRVERSRRDYQRGAQRATKRTSDTIREHVPPVLTSLRKNSEVPDLEDDLTPAETASHRVIDVELHGQSWRIILELSTDPAVGNWLEISDHIARNHADGNSDDCRAIGVRLSLIHPFMQRFCGTDCEEIEPLLRVAAALGLAEIAARDSGMEMAGMIRRNVNELLRNALCRT